MCYNSSVLAQRGYIKSFDGTKLFYTIEGQGTPLVFCYGLVCSSLHWCYQLEYFRQKYQVIWLDYRGQNHSETPACKDKITLAHVAMDLKVLLKELNISKAVFLGHSMGVNIVLEFFRQYHSSVSAMVLINGAPRGPLETLFAKNYLQKWFKFLIKTNAKFPFLLANFWKLQRLNPFLLNLVKKKGFNSSLTPDKKIKQFYKEVFKTDFLVFLQLMQDYESYDCLQWLHTIDVPTLIIAGEKDKVIPLHQQELLHQLIPNSSLEIIKHGSHSPQMDLPELINLKIENFLNPPTYLATYLAKYLDSAQISAEST
ncbi:MAG: alpha/beta hydrolase [Bdellovibrio sp.]|nr:alpha/beta hydrolase [Bdellovibrio sp.]